MVGKLLTRTAAGGGDDLATTKKFDPTSSIAKIGTEKSASDANSVSTGDITSSCGTSATTATSTSADIGIGVADVHPEAELIQDAMAAKSLAHKLDVEPPPYKLPRTRPVVIGHRGSIYEGMLMSLN
jgi:S-formylglutathione hydrolase FrmB